MGPSKSVEKPTLFVSAQRNALIGKARNPVLISDPALSDAVLGPAAAGAIPAVSALDRVRKGKCWLVCARSKP